MPSVRRLITQFVPGHYQLSLKLDRMNRAFDGTVTIQGISSGNSGTITVHAKGLHVSSVVVDGKTATYKIQANDELEITHPDITAGRHIVVISFNGKITDAMHGLYPCYYTHDGHKKELLATQFESHHAREVFPCIDEPEAKASFDLTLTTEQNVTALGNMPIIRQKVEHDKLVTTFNTTPRMSTYLLAWVVGQLHRKTATTQSGIEVNVWATPAQPAATLDFALDYTVRTIEFFNDYFGVDYPLPKSDHVALPDFTAGAMENWGLITYREIALLAHPTRTAISGKRYIMKVIAHELSHQWFGNLVTMKWWNNLWLNESFATLMEYVATDALHPEWNAWLEMANFRNILALERDSIDGVQPVQTDVQHPDEISTLFDPAIVYAKGARLLKMLQHYIGPEAFRAGLQAYFKKYAYKNTEGDDLWQEFSAVSGKDVTVFMNQWISRPGYPVVKVQQDDGTISLQQEQFFIGPHKDSDAIWPIPLNASGSLPDLLDERKYTGRLAPREALVQLNIGDSAHFITCYDDQLLHQLIQNIATLSPLDRLQLLHEQLMLARGKMVSSATLIPLLLAHKNETNEAVWNIIARAIGELKKFVETDITSEQQLGLLARSLAHHQYKTLGWQPQPDEPEDMTKLRATIMNVVLDSKADDAILAATKLYHSTPLEQLTPELRPLIISAAVRYGDDPAIIANLLERYQTVASADLKKDIAKGLSSTRQPQYIKQLLAAMKDSTIVRPQDVRHWFVWLSQHKEGRELTWQWLQDNWGWIEKTFGSDKSYDDFPRYAAAALTTRQQLEEYRAFFGPLKKEPALTRVITLGISEIEGKVDLIEHDQTAVRQALAQL